MCDKLNQKVIKLFSKAKKGQPVCCDEKVHKCESGYHYVCLKTDDNGKHFDEETLLKKANECYYIVKVMIKKSLSPQIYNYKVQGSEILDFLKGYINGEYEGKVIEIDKFYPEEWA